MITLLRRIFEKVVSGIFYVSTSEEDKKIISKLQNRKYSSAHEAVRAHSEKINESQKKVPGIAKNLTPGDLSNNESWLYIQDIGDYISPIGNDKKHTVTIYEVRPRTPKVKIAEIVCTNSIYSEWLVACSNSMWKTKVKTAFDISGNFYNLGKMISTVCEITY